MKAKKLLAAVLAGTMVMASASVVFAASTATGTAWWSDDRVSSDYYTIEGDGVWNIAIATAGYSGILDDEEFFVGPAFCVELTSEVDAGTTYITSTCFGDGWIAEAATEESDSGCVAGGNGEATYTGDVWAIDVTREGQDFYLNYYQNGTKMVKQSFIGTNFADSVNLQILGQTGYCVVECTTDGSIPEVEALTDDWYGGDYDTEEKTAEADSSDDTADAEEDDAADAEEDEDDADVEEDDADAEDEAEEEDEEESSGLSAGAIAAIIIIVVVVIVVIVIAVVMSGKNKKKSE